MHDRPDIPELLDAVQKFLDDEVVPATKGRKQFLARVAANCIRMVDRELQAESKHFDEAWSGLNALSGAALAPEGRDARAHSVTERLEALCARIRSGEIDEGSDEWDRVIAFVRNRVRDKLEVSNPKLLATDAKRGIV